ncbi:MAG TPA: substrate-binding domain-containing protein [Gemmatimonadaceae bacterium]|nr:substrate-binding domain-containing protein [Gemmatimonadaceae bacterium]
MTRVLLVLALLLPLAPTAPREFVVVVHRSNPATTLRDADVAKLFLRKVDAWPHGVPVQPVDLVESRTREAFTRDVHHKDVALVKAYWQKQIYSGRQLPPPEKRTDRDVLQFVRATPGGIGYVAAGTPLDPGVKVIEVVGP